ncbi:MAG TPA: Calx-beta domain-containing protein [Roseiflexaceae bacterium]
MLGTPTNTTVTITDDDPPPSVAWQSASFSVGEGAGSGLATAQLSAASGFTVTVNYATSNGTATAGSDYTARSGTLTFGPGATSANFTVPITNDATIEVTETVNLTLSSPTNATLGTPTPAALAILDDDGAPPPTDEYYTYNKLGNLTSKTGKGSYSYPASGSAHPHAVTSTSDGQTYVYDANGNMTSVSGLISSWDAENRPSSLSRISGTEDAAYDADGEQYVVRLDDPGSCACETSYNIL